MCCSTSMPCHYKYQQVNRSDLDILGPPILGHNRRRHPLGTFRGWSSFSSCRNWCTVSRTRRLRKHRRRCPKCFDGTHRVRNCYMCLGGCMSHWRRIEFPHRVELMCDCSRNRHMSDRAIPCVSDPMCCGQEEKNRSNRIRPCTHRSNHNDLHLSLMPDSVHGCYNCF